MYGYLDNVYLSITTNRWFYICPKGNGNNTRPHLPRETRNLFLWGRPGIFCVSRKSAARGRLLKKNKSKFLASVLPFTPKAYPERKGNQMQIQAKCVLAQIKQVV
jgi:hypothetical protein